MSVPTAAPPGGPNDAAGPGYPSSLVPVNHVEPVPRRIRAYLASAVVLDTTRARYVWEHPHYPQYYVPRDDVAADLLVPEGEARESPRGTVVPHGVRRDALHRPAAAEVLTASPIPGLADTVHFTWSALDAWFEEDEQVFVHPRSPYARVDALRSTRTVRIERDGVVLAESSSPVLVFETGLPTRYYLNRVDVDWSRLEPSPTVTACPYKGTTSGYWSAQLNGRTHRDVAWAYDFPTLALAPIAGLVAFYNERVDTFVDGVELPRPKTRL
jgi:uncharacterized protein (DUF427 family)